MKAAVANRPWVFSPTKDGYKKSNVDMQKFEVVMASLGPQHFGTSEDWGDVWRWHGMEFLHKDDTDDLQESFGHADKTFADTLTEYVDLRGLKE